MRIGCLGEDFLDIVELGFGVNLSDSAEGEADSEGAEAVHDDAIHGDIEPMRDSVDLGIGEVSGVEDLRPDIEAKDLGRMTPFGAGLNARIPGIQSVDGSCHAREVPLKPFLIRPL